MPPAAVRLKGVSSQWTPPSPPGADLPCALFCSPVLFSPLQRALLIVALSCRSTREQTPLNSPYKIFLQRFPAADQVTIWPANPAPSAPRRYRNKRVTASKTYHLAASYFVYCSEGKPAGTALQEEGKGNLGVRRGRGGGRGPRGAAVTPRSLGEVEESERRKEMRWITFLPGREEGGSEGGETWVL